MQTPGACQQDGVPSKFCHSHYARLNMDTVISISHLLTIIGTASAPLVIDVRRREAFDADSRMIAGAVYRSSEDVEQWIERLPKVASIVVYCVHGLEVGKGVAYALRERGLKATYLEGGIEAWKEARGPTLRKLQVLPVEGESQWVTRERPKIDRIACPWLVRRFIDATARFHYVPADQVLQAANTLRAIPYDVADVTFTHRGECCSFDALLKDFDLHDAALEQLAIIVRGADTKRLDLAPQCAGLLAASLDLSANYSDDLEMLEHGLALYDALYSSCRLDQTGNGERHQWDEKS